MCVSAAVAVLGVCVDYLADADRPFGRVRREGCDDGTLQGEIVGTVCTLPLRCFRVLYFAQCVVGLEGGVLSAKNRRILYTAV